MEPHVAAVLLGNGEYLQSFTPQQLRALPYVVVRMHNRSAEKWRKTRHLLGGAICVVTLLSLCACGRASSAVNVIDAAAVAAEAKAAIRTQVDGHDARHVDKAASIFAPDTVDMPAAAP